MLFTYNFIEVPGHVGRNLINHLESKKIQATQGRNWSLKLAQHSENQQFL